jgi:hypothetical protein
MTFTYNPNDLIQTAIDSRMRDNIAKVTKEKPSGSFSEPSHPKQGALGKAVVGAAVVAIGGLLMNWLTSSAQSPANEKPKTGLE